MNLKEEWFGNVRGDIVAGLVVSMALLPEVIGFSIAAGVDPMAGIYASFIISVVISVFGGRSGMISAAAGSVALVLAPLVSQYGFKYMLLAGIFAGIIQIILGIFKAGNLIKFIPEAVMTGFVNALGIMMFKSQIKYFKGTYILLILGALGIAIIYLFPLITKSVPSPIISIITVSIITAVSGINIPRLYDMGKITAEFPKFFIPDVPLNFETFKIILPYSVSVAIVGLVESLLTAQIVDEHTKTESNKNMECVGQGLSNIASCLFGGIAGCGMIGQTIVNKTYGGKGRLSTFASGTILMLAVVVLNRFVKNIPVVALGAVMVTVAAETFDFKSVINIKNIPARSTAVMIATVITVLFTDNLAYGVVTGTSLDYLWGRIKK